MKQGKGIIAILGAMISGLARSQKPDHKKITELQATKNALILNTGGVIPARLPNQRQRRKLARQTGNYK